MPAPPRGCSGVRCAAHGCRRRRHLTRQLPDYVQRASRLSGGLLSLREAPEVYLGHELGGRFAARLSGNLGNEVGRGGTEGVGTRGARLDILDPALLRDAARVKEGHWLLDNLEPAARRPSSSSCSTKFRSLGSATSQSGITLRFNKARTRTGRSSRPWHADRPEDRCSPDP